MKTGRPRGLNINHAAVEHLRRVEHLSPGELALAAEITPGHLADMLRREKGASHDVVRRLAAALHCDPAVIAPELLNRPRFVAVRDDDLDLVEAVGQ